MFILFQVPAFSCGPSDPEIERSLWPAWEDPYRLSGFIDVNRDPAMEARYEWRPQRFVDPAEMMSI